ncbi:ribonuclease E [Kribbella orskensis]|uniref:Ribonuclease E n=1 Tax=Kribbella orskensis TaxID=2512216 RepID=A0ABY2BA90_9ACTN|nr:MULTISPECIES: Rne/Rng family ribonuclease [Kribbella]TCN30039.1 ribonuclease E [Kribbella sp. VKM Ac-2500]TCO10221.1 ribonuclease E [Kribbella orskensis]
MLDNEPNITEAAESAVAAPTQPPAKKAAAKKTVRKRTTKKAAAQTAPADAETAISTQADAEAADPAPAPAKKAAAKRTVKKAAAKRPAKKAAARNSGQDSLLDASDDATAVDAAAGSTSLADAGPVQSSADSAAQGGSDASAAPAKKTTRRRTSKKAAAAPQADLLTTDNPVSDGPVASADVPEKELTEEELAAAEAAAAEAAAAEAAAQTNAQGDSAQPEPAEGGSRRRRRAPAAAAVLFQAPVDVPAQAAATSPVEATPAEAPSGRRTRRRSGAAETAANEQTAVTDAPEVIAETTEVAADEQPSSTRRRRSRRSRDAEEVAADRAEPVLEEARNTEADEDTDEDHAAEADENDGEEGGEGTRRRRRRRGGRRRRKSGDADGSDDSAEEQEEDSDESDDQQDDTDEHDQSGESEDETEGPGSSSRRRRRRRRRKGEEPGSAPDDPDETVVRVREPRSKTISNEITAVEGSTRLEAKKQRRREGRAAGRRRAPIVTEAEFLARRESVERTMVIRARGDLTQIAVSEDNVLVEHYVAQEEQVSLIGNVYLGRVQNVLPSMEAAFIDIGKGRNAVLYAGEVDWNTLGGGNGPRKIESVLKSGQAVLVQVTKDPIGHKGARLTNQISLPGRYVVYVPRGGNGGISRKLPDTERNRLKGILKDIVPDEAGVIVRTAAEGATEDELTRDVSRLQSYWEDIEKKSKSGQAPQLLHGEPDLLIRVVRDLFTEDFTKLVISGDDAYDQVKEYVSYVAPHLADRVEKWAGDGDVFSNYRIDEQIKKALDRKVWLPSGGSLIIDRTEAMTVVDVNTGKFTGSGGNLEETVTKNNLEAAEEIVRQLRLRDIGGIIVIDFIDMVLELNRDLVLRRLVECLGRDRTKHQVAEVTSLGLVQMTRKRIGTGLLEAFSENCDHCGGRGLILHDEPKESRRRQDDGRNRGQQQSQTDQKTDGEGAKKSSRSRNRGKGRGRGDGPDELPETEQQSHDAAQRLAQIAAASSVTNAEAQSDRAQSDQAQSDHSPGEQDQADRSASDQSRDERPQDDHSQAGQAHEERTQGDSQGDQASAAQAQEGSEGAAGDEAEAGAEKAQQNGSGRGGSTRRRRGGRSRAKADDSGDSDAGNNESDAGVSAPELESTPV